VLIGALSSVGGPLRAADAVPGERWCGVPDGDGIVRAVDRIEFAGNRVTRPEIMLREVPQQVGERCSLDAVIDGIQRLMNLDLFRSIRVELDLEQTVGREVGREVERKVGRGTGPGAGSRAGTRDATDGTLVLRFIVREKFFFFALPRLSRTSDGELRTGLQLRWDNFTGRLHEVRITAERRQEDDGRGRSGFVRRLDYLVPRFLGSDWGASLSLAAEERQVGFGRESAVFGEGRREVHRLGLGVARWLGGSDGVQGWSAQVGLGIEARELTVDEGDSGPYEGGFDASVGVGLGYREVHRESYRRRGQELELGITAAGKWSGSDFAYHRFDLRYTRYVPLRGGLRNLNVRAKFGVSDGAPFGEDTYSIGGGEQLRGIAPGRDVGDLLALVNVEYLQAFFTRPAWRWVVFGDIGNVHPKGRFRLLAQNARVGVGLRYKLRALSRTDLRLDLGWDADRGKVVTYVATSVTF